MSEPESNPIQLIGAGITFLVALCCMVLSIRTTPLGHWLFLGAGLMGYVLLLGSAELTLRGVGLTPGPGFFRGTLGTARAMSGLTTALVLLPLLGFVFLLSKESGPGWSVTALFLLGVVGFCGAASLVGLLSSRR
ncbi:MAG: hypothetical protein KC776_31290 [Myxococcales bacterium]|nr:hypothetical protein [Myxococcales bacterium]MCB9581644.1 hypothetical protein [Polyangiaceae bacterium]